MKAADILYIMENWKKNDFDFQFVYYDFYLKARGTMRGNNGNREKYFEMLQSISEETPLIEIVKTMQEELPSHSLEFSLCTKLLHTRNASYPIYDSKVRKYLIEEEKIELWWQYKGAPRNTSELAKINHDWDALCNWYKDILCSEKGKNWITWFDANFPEYKDISNYKKIDFMIFATN